MAPPITTISIIIPARNEAENLRALLPRLRATMPNAQILVVDDGSTDDTCAVCTANNIEVISHPYGMGNGATIKTGVRAARGEIIVCMDGDGQHDPQDIPQLLAKLETGYDMVVGARDWSSQATIGRGLANRLYNRLATWMVEHPIPDLTSGLRAVRTRKFREFLYLLPNGFSYPTTITMAFFRAGYAVHYIPIHAGQRGGKSHIKILRDGMRFLLIIFRIGTLYSPLKLFIPVSSTFASLGIGYYLYTFITAHRFTNMSALLLSVAVIVFMIGLVSEQITNLAYSVSSFLQYTQDYTQEPSNQSQDVNQNLSAEDNTKS
jgi:glycosyltransferase involved in cell wall biosynthesis